MGGGSDCIDESVVPLIRYDIDRPKLPAMPLPTIDHRHLKCDSDGSNHQNASTKAQPQKLDSSKFFAPHLPGKSIEGPTFKSTYIDEEYKFLSKSEPLSELRSAFSIEEFLQGIDTHLLKIMFLVLDILIVVYRFSRTYMTATTLCRGFEQSVTLRPGEQVLKPALKEQDHELQNLRNQAKHMSPGVRTSEHAYLKDDKDTMDTTLTDYSATLDSQKSMLQPKTNSTALHPFVQNDVGGTKLVDSSRSHKWTKKKWDTCKHITGKLLQSTVVPKLLLAFVLLILFYVVVSVLCVVFSLDTMEEADGFRSFLAGLDVQVNQTNWYLNTQAEHFNSVTMKIYEKQMRSELLHLQSMLEYFNAGVWYSSIVLFLCPVLMR